jgi:two-component system chemotaxis response regulator CheB
LETIKVLVIDDSAFMRKLISDFLNEHPQIEVIGTARNGEEGLEKIHALKPNVVTLDIEMPVLNGLETLERIMKQYPLPVIMLSSQTKAGTEITIRCLQKGAFDFIEKPSGSISLDLYKVKEQLIEKVMHTYQAQQKVKFQHHKITPKNQIENRKERKRSPNEKVIVAIGTSTGGPKALHQVIPFLRKQPHVVYFVVQHMPPGFTHSLAKRLNAVSELFVKEAEQGEKVQHGVVYIAPGGYNMKIVQKGNELQIDIVDTMQNEIYRPSVNILFESLSKIKGYSKIAVIMTGMGSDGTAGLKLLKSDENVTSIAQSEESSIIFGMPKAAIAANVIDYIVDLKDMAKTIKCLI